MTRVRYHCVKHGQFFADVACGKRVNSGPDQIACPSCGQSAHRRRTDEMERNISVSGATFARLKAFCTAQGISMSSLVETLTKDIP